MNAALAEREAVYSPDVLPADERYLWTERFDLLPREAIKNITFNPKLADVEDPRIQAWLDPETVYSHAIFSIGTDSGDRTTINSPSAHRSTILERNVEEPFFVHGLPYSEVSAKGTGMTKQHVYMLPKLITEPYAVPGFLALDIAEESMEKLNAFADAGGRGGITLAIAELDPVILRKWFESHPEYIPTDPKKPFERHMRYDPIWWLNLIEQYQKKPAIEFRLKATSNYMDTVRFDPNSGQPLEADDMYSEAAVLHRSACLIAQEIQQRGQSEFARHYRLGSLSIENGPKGFSYSEYDRTPDAAQITYGSMIRALQEALENQDLRSLKKAVYPFELYFHGWNLGVKERLAQERGEFKTNFSQQNADHAGYVYDMGGVDHTPDIGTSQLFKFHTFSREGDHMWEYDLHEAGFRAGFAPTVVVSDLIGVEFPVFEDIVAVAAD